MLLQLSTLVILQHRQHSNTRQCIDGAPDSRDCSWGGGPPGFSLGGFSRIWRVTGTSARPSASMLPDILFRQHANQTLENLAPVDSCNHSAILQHPASICCCQAPNRLQSKITIGRLRARQKILQRSAESRDFVKFRRSTAAQHARLWGLSAMHARGRERTGRRGRC